jgi:signal transduction histidine kinase
MRLSVVAYMVAAFGLCIVGLGVVMTTTTTASFRRERERAGAELRMAAQNAAAADEKMLPQAAQFLTGIAGQPNVRSLDPVKCGDAFTSLSALAEAVNIVVVSPTNAEVCGLNHASASGIAIPAGDWVGQVRATNAPVWSGASLDPHTGLPVMVVAVPVPGVSGAVVVAAFATSSQAVNTPTNSLNNLILVEIDGAREMVLAKSDKAPHKPGKLPASSWLRHGLGHDTVRRDADGVTRLYREVPVPGLNRYMLAGVPLHSALGEAREEMQRNIQVMALVIVLVGALGALMHRQIASPIRRLKKTIAAAAEDETVRATVSGPSELAALAQVFNETMTERHRLEDELADALQNAQDASRLKSEFLANMSHEIRTPMNGVLGILSLLDSMDLSDELRDYIVTMSSSAEALMAILNDLLDFSKLEAGMVRAEATAFDLPSTLDAVIAPRRPTTTKKGLDLRAVLDEDVPSEVMGDSLRLRQILTNLVDNAIKFTARGSVVVQVRKGSHGFVRFEVVDTGIGIPSAVADTLFDPFVQADGTTTRRYGGTGLGLSICRQLVDLMGGTIGLVSTPGMGSSFWFELPMHAAGQAAPAPTAVEPADEATPSTADAKAAARILVAEDNPINQKVATQMLRKLGYEVEIAGNGREAVDAVASGSFVAVLMDLQMPLMDGFEATIELRARGFQIPIVAMTASALGTDRDRCAEAGMDGYLTKPVSTTALGAQLRQVVRPRVVA